MEISIDEGEIVEVIHEFLLSKNLFLTADALEKETGLSSSHCHNEHLNPLRQLAVDGKWEEVREYLHVLAELLDDNTNKQILFLLFRQRFCELCFSSNDVNVETAMKDIVEELHSYCTQAEYDSIVNEVYAYYDLQIRKQTSSPPVMATRLECLHEITRLVEPFLNFHGLSTHAVDLDKERLISAVVKGFLYEKCLEDCGLKKSTDMQSHGDSATMSPFLSSTSMSNINTFLVHWCQEQRRGFKAMHPDGFDCQKVVLKRKPLQHRSFDLIPSPSTSPNKVNDDGRASAGEMHSSGTAALKALSPEKPKHSPHQSLSNFQTLNDIQPTESSPQQSDVMSESKSHAQAADQKDLKHMSDSQKYVDSMSHRNMQDNAMSDISDKIPANINPKDSYADFMAQQMAARNERDRILKALQQKEGESSKIRQQLLNSATESTSAVKSPETKAKFQFCFSPTKKTEDMSAIRAVAFHPLGEVFAVGSNSQTLKICAMPTEPISSTLSEYKKFQTETGHNVEMQLIMKKTRVHKGSIYALAWNGHFRLYFPFICV